MNTWYACEKLLIKGNNFCCTTRCHQRPLPHRQAKQAVKTKPLSLKKMARALSHLLRHGAVNCGLAIRDDGYVKVSDITARSFSLNTESDFEIIVGADPKMRFSLARFAESGHSVEQLYIRLTKATVFPASAQTSYTLVSRTRQMCRCVFMVRTKTPQTDPA